MSIFKVEAVVVSVEYVSADKLYKAEVTEVTSSKDRVAYFPHRVNVGDKVMIR